MFCLSAYNPAIQFHHLHVDFFYYHCVSFLGDIVNQNALSRKTSLRFSDAVNTMDVNAMPKKKVMMTQSHYYRF